MSVQTTVDRFVRHRGPVTCAAGIPGTDEVVTSGYDGAVALYNLTSGSVELLGFHRHLVNRVVVDAGGHLLIDEHRNGRGVLHLNEAATVSA